MSDKYLGDFEKGQTLRVKFNTFSQALVPTTPSVNPTVAIYKDSATEFTTGVTQPTVDYDSKAGLHELVIDTSDSVYEVGKDYDIVFTAGTVDGVDLTRTILRTFSIENRNIDANVVKIAGETANAAAAVTFPASVASEATVGNIETDTQDIQSRIPAALVGGRIDSYLGATANNVITHNTLASDCIANSQLATSAINAIQSGLATSTQATAIEVDTQDIQSRLPAALVDGRMVSVAQVVSDKTGYKLASDGLTLVTSWTVDITGSLSGSVGSISGVTFPSNFGLLGIDGAGIVLQVGTVDELGANALTANGAGDAIEDYVWDAQSSQHTTAGTTGKALIDSGAAGNPWSTDLSSGYTGTQAGNILNSVKSQTDLIQSGGTVTVSTPVTSSGQLASPLIIGDDYLAANGRGFSWTVPLPSGFDASTAACKFGMRYEDDQGVNNFIATGTVTDAGGGNVTLAFDVARTVTGLLRPGWYDWSVEIVSASGAEITRVKSGKNAEWQEKQT